MLGVKEWEARLTGRNSGTTRWKDEIGERKSLYQHTNAIRKMTLIARVPGHTLATGQSVMGIWGQEDGWML